MPFGLDSKQVKMYAQFQLSLWNSHYYHSKLPYVPNRKIAKNKHPLLIVVVATAAKMGQNVNLDTKYATTNLDHIFL